MRYIELIRVNNFGKFFSKNHNFPEAFLRMSNFPDVYKYLTEKKIAVTCDFVNKNFVCLYEADVGHIMIQKCV